MINIHFITYRINNSEQMVGREMFDSQIQCHGDWKDIGTRMRNKDFVRRWFANHQLKTRKTNNITEGTFHCLKKHKPSRVCACSL